jgi:hypothetical protein
VPCDRITGVLNTIGVVVVAALTASTAGVSFDGQNVATDYRWQVRACAEFAGIKALAF